VSSCSGGNHTTRILHSEILPFASVAFCPHSPLSSLRKDRKRINLIKLTEGKLVRRAFVCRNFSVCFSLPSCGCVLQADFWGPRPNGIVPDRGGVDDASVRPASFTSQEERGTLVGNFLRGGLALGILMSGFSHLRESSSLALTQTVVWLFVILYEGICSPTCQHALRTNLCGHTIVYRQANTHARHAHKHTNDHLVFNL